MIEFFVTNRDLLICFLDIALPECKNDCEDKNEGNNYRFTDSEPCVTSFILSGREAALTFGSRLIFRFLCWTFIRKCSLVNFWLE